MAEAFELIGRTHLPSERAMAEAHRKVLAFIEKDIPAPFIYNIDGPTYNIYPEKLLHKTWRALVKSDLVRTDRHQEVDLTRPMGLALMNILADCCAGKTRARITDERDAYRNVMTLLSADKRLLDDADESHEFLVPHSLRVFEYRPDSTS
jgi:hypothetical protein